MDEIKKPGVSMISPLVNFDFYYRIIFPSSWSMLPIRYGLR